MPSQATSEWHLSFSNLQVFEIYDRGGEMYYLKKNLFCGPNQEASKPLTLSKHSYNMAAKTEKQLLQLLKTIEGNGSFATSAVKNFVPPGLHIKGLGEIGFPLSPILAKEIIRVAKKAPFGKGRRTVIDPTVRSAWEIDADQLSFHHTDWKKLIEEIVAEVKIGLGMPEVSVKASLYKLLLYETGDFFLPHKDSEKEPGMFGTLAIGLPSSHAGGALAVRFDGREAVADFSPTASNYKIPYVAFFADCDHEIKPVTSGYRVVLVYNLVYAAGTKKTAVPKIATQASEIANLLRTMAKTKLDNPKVILLEHQYTPANFSLASLKQHDQPRAQALLMAADQAGYFARLGLVTHYLMGDMEEKNYGYRGRSRRYRDDYEEENRLGSGTMGEVYETSTSIKHWAHETGPGLGDLSIEKEDLITDETLGKGEPIEKEEEGYTGNAGMTIEYWYHYGAVVLWPADQHTALLSNNTISVQLQWLEYYLQHWENKALRSQEYARQLLVGFKQVELTEIQHTDLDFSVVAAVLAKLQDQKFLIKGGTELLTTVFGWISVEAWINLLQHYPSELFAPVFKKAAATDEVLVIDHLLNTLVALEALDEHSLNVFLSGQIRDLPQIINKVEFSKLDGQHYSMKTETRKGTITDILDKVLWFSEHKPAGEAWVKDAFQAITRSLSRKYVNQVLAVVLLQRKHPHNALANALHAVCIREVAGRTAIKPAPPPDWTREVPKSESYYREVWDILRPFLASPTERIFEYRKAEAYRSQMESAIKSSSVDLKMETLKNGSPYILKLTKTQVAYEKALGKWQEDVALLEQLNLT